MGNKITPILIAILLIVAVVVVGIGVKVILFSDNNNSGEVEKKVSVPIVELNQETSEDGSKVEIKVSGYTEEGTEIKQITLPDGTVKVGQEATYTVEENGEYEFILDSADGGSTTKTIIITDIPEISATNPYIPDGFEYVGGNPDRGYVIKDKYENQYVWVPVESGRLTRETMLNTEYEESSNAATELVNSVSKYHGFYIGRFEASEYDLDGTKVAASISYRMPWTNITCQDAINYAKESGTKFGYTDCSTALLSSYAWDTVMGWIDVYYPSYSSNTNYGNYSGTVYPTGHQEDDVINNICDLAGNIREWTTEIYKPATSATNGKKKNEATKKEEKIIYRVVRGGSANLSRTPAAHIGYAEDTADNYWGFRLVLYK